MDMSNPRARPIGVVYLLYFLSALASGTLLKEFVLPNDAAATANGILANEPMYRLAVSLDLVGNALYIALTALFYILFRPVDSRIALLAAFFGLAGGVIQLFGGLFELAPLVVLKDSHFASVFQPEQVRAAVMLSFKMYNQIYSVSLPLFGFFMFPMGWLIIRSTFLPRIIGVFWMCAGVGALTFLWPSSLWLPAATATTLSGIVFALAGVAEGSMMLWLLVMGVNLAKWRTVTGGLPTA